MGELSRFGLQPLESGRGLVRFETPPEGAARFTLLGRTVPRLVLELGERCPAETQAVRDLARGIPWETWLPQSQPWAVHAVGRSPALRHTLYTARVVKDGIRDRFAAVGKTCPPVDPANPKFWVDLHIDRGEASIGVDLGGGSLHRRGRAQEGKAPLREDIAAGLAWLAGVTAGRPLVDPFCGSGTLIVEAAAIVLGFPPGRRPSDTALPWLFPFSGLPLPALARDTFPLPDSGAPILAADRDPAAVRSTRSNLLRQDLSSRVEVRQCAVENLVLPFSDWPGLVLTNPPWGLRLGSCGPPGPAGSSPGEEAALAWRSLGNWAHRLADGWRMAVLSGNPALTRLLGLRAERKWPVLVGGVETRLLVYSIG